MKILITGGAGFIGHHVVDYFLREYDDVQLVLLDRLDNSGNLNRLTELESFDPGRVRFVFHDLRAPINGQVAHKIGHPDFVIHMAAATHVDRSIDDPMSFVMDNVVATCNLLNFLRTAHVDKIIHFSTDEVFGPAPDGVAYREDDRYRSGNPYAATKAGAEELCVAYANTYKMPIVVTHCMNVFGERQHPEKFIPMTIAKVLAGEVVTIHSDKSKTRAGSRFYIHAQQVANAVDFLLYKGRPGQKYNIVGEQEVDNLELATAIANRLQRPLRYEMVDFHSSRPGHDLRYALDGSKMGGMGWTPINGFLPCLHNVVDWSVAHPEWLASSLVKEVA